MDMIKMVGKKKLHGKITHIQDFHERLKTFNKRYDPVCFGWIRESGTSPNQVLFSCKGKISKKIKKEIDYLSDLYRE